MGSLNSACNRARHFRYACKERCRAAPFRGGILWLMPGIVLGLFAGFLLDSPTIILIVTIAVNAAVYLLISRQKASFGCTLWPQVDEIRRSRSAADKSPQNSQRQILSNSFACRRRYFHDASEKNRLIYLPPRRKCHVSLIHCANERSAETGRSPHPNW